MIYIIQNNIEFDKVCDLIRTMFNSEIHFVNKDSINDDYYIQFNNINLDNPRCLNIIDYKSDQHAINLLNMYDYYYILDCDLKTADFAYEKLVYLAYVLYNFIIINTKMVTNKPIVFDPISTIKYLLNTKSSLVRFGDGEILYMDNVSINYADSVQKYIDPVIMKHCLLSIMNNTSVIRCIPDSFYNEYHDNCFYIDNQNKNTIQNGSYMCRDKYNKFILSDHIYGSCFIGRIYGYKSINTSRYVTFYINNLIKNKNNIIICSYQEYKKFLDTVYFSSNNNIFIICPYLVDAKDSFNIENYVNKILKICSSSSSSHKNIYLHFGIYSKYISYIFQKHNINTIDAGSFDLKTKLNKNIYYGINNVLSILNYYIFHNNTIKYNIKSNFEILDEMDGLIINIEEVLMNSDMCVFGIRFNQSSLSEHYLKSVIKGILKVESNIPLKIFDGNNWLHININSYNNEFEIYNVNKWRISPSNEYLQEHIGEKNIEFILYNIEFKINEIIILE